jgi:hypothetical protein
MTGYVPTIEEYSQLRAEFMELCDDYLVLYLMRGQRDFCDTFLSPSEKAQREEAAWETANNLMDLVERIDTLAGTPALGEDWPELLAISERYAGVHESFKPMRVVAEAWRVDIGQSVADLRRGRPPLISDSEFPQLYSEAYERAKLTAEYHDERLTKDGVGLALGLEGRKSLQNYLDRHGLQWPPENSS